MFIDFAEPLTVARSEQPSEAERCYDLGITCSSQAGQRDLIEAHMWFNLAARAGDPRGADARAWVAEEVTRGQIAEAQRRARAFMRDAA